MLCLLSRCHNWALASRLMAAASVFRHPRGNSVQKRSIPVPDWVPFSVSGWFQQKHFSLHSGTGVAGCQHSKTFYKDEKGYIHEPCASTLQAIDWDTPCTCTLTRGAHSPAGEGLVESQFRRLEKKLSTLPTLWAAPWTTKLWKG